MTILLKLWIVLRCKVSLIDCSHARSTYVPPPSYLHSISPPKIRITGSIPDFNDNMIRQRISTHGVIREMEPASDIPALNISLEEICVMHAGPTKRWLDAKQIWDDKYAKQNRKVRRAREREYLDASNRGLQYGDVMGETPPPSALAGRLRIQKERVRDQGEKNKNIV